MPLVAFMMINPGNGQSFFQSPARFQPEINRGVIQAISISTLFLALKLTSQMVMTDKAVSSPSSPGSFCLPAAGRLTPCQKLL